MIKVAILGFGIVGSGVYELLNNNGKLVADKAGKTIEIKRVLDIRDFSDHPSNTMFTTNIDEINSDAEISIVVETMGGVEPAYGYVKSALLAGKSVVTSNKQLVAEHGTELIKIAKEKGICFLFEASVGGGTPIISPLHRSLIANRINAVYGIVNGTTNYILGRMEEVGLSYDDALAEAQKLGFAEANPSADIDGIDALRKLSILASISFGKYLSPDKIPTVGIRNITASDISSAVERGMSVKLVAYAREDGNTLYCGVAPLLVPKSNILASINGVYNGVVAKCDMLGDVLFYGQGAGGIATASAVVSDIAECSIIGTKIHDTLYWGEQQYENIAAAVAPLSTLSDVVV